MTEKEIKDKAEQIVDAFVALSLGKEPGMLSNDVFKKLSTHSNFEQIRAAINTYVQNFDGKVDSPEAIKRLFDFRMEIVELYGTV